MIELFHHVSPEARAIRMALEELGLPYETRWADTTSGSPLDADYASVDPDSKVPAIIDHDGPGGAPIALSESGAILLYLAEKTGRLLSADPAARWAAVGWVFWQAANQAAGSGDATGAPANVHDDARTRFVSEASRCDRVLEEHLTGREYLAGEFSVADIAVFSWTCHGEGHGDLSYYPAVRAWSSRIASRPSAEAAAEDRRGNAPANFDDTIEPDTGLFASFYRPGYDGACIAYYPPGIPGPDNSSG